MSISEAAPPHPPGRDRPGGPARRSVGHDAHARAHVAPPRASAPEPPGTFEEATQGRLQQVFDAAALGIGITTTDGRFVDVNPKGCELLGRSLDELRGMTIADVTHPDDLAETARHLQGLFARGEGTYTVEKRYLHPDGSVRWCRTSVSLLTSREGTRYLMGIMEDVSDRRAAQAQLEAVNAELQHNERQYRTLVDNVPGVIYRARAEEPFELLFVSDGVTELLGYEPAELLQRRISPLEYIHPDDIHLIVQTLEQRTAAVDEPFEYEFRILHADGSVRWVYDKSRCVVDDEAGSLVFDGVLFDITAQREAEEALRRREVRAREADREREHVRQLQALAQAAIDVQASLDLDEMFSRVTQAACDIVGARVAVASLTERATDEVPDGWPQSSIVLAGEGGAGPDAWHDAVLYASVCERNEVVRLTADELAADPRFADDLRRLPLRGWLAAPLVGRDGANLGLLQVTDHGRDEFTERDEAIVVQLAQMASAAIDKTRLLEASARQEAQRFREELLSGISHDMQTPLAAIVGLAELLIDAPDADPDERLDSYKALHRQASGLRTLVQQFLDYSRLQADRRLALRIRPTSMAAAIERTVAMFSHLREFRVEVPDELPPIEADDHRVEQALSNLLSNAVKFSTAPIEIRAYADDGYVAVDVTDRGVGMDEEDLERLFEKFHRGASGSGTRGTGIGLYISHAVTEAQGGTLTATSTPGQGSTFTLRLPRALA